MGFTAAAPQGTNTSMMFKYTRAAGLLMFLALQAGCIYTNVRTPGPTNQVTNFNLTTADFQIIGPVEADGEITTILGLVMYGGDGYGPLLEKARAKGADEVIHYRFDIEDYAILTFVYNRARWKARGTAVKYREEAME